MVVLRGGSDIAQPATMATLRPFTGCIQIYNEWTTGIRLNFPFRNDNIQMYKQKDDADSDVIIQNTFNIVISS